MTYDIALLRPLWRTGKASVPGAPIRFCGHRLALWDRANRICALAASSYQLDTTISPMQLTVALIDLEGRRDSRIEHCATNETEGFSEVMAYGTPELTSESTVPLSLSIK